MFLRIGMNNSHMAGEAGCQGAAVRGPESDTRETFQARE
ncbi:hypothetical protein CRUP_001353 [Coryphaenoides rupestris]|nr:hypothetical protein CRUP_001353 [Coryphaenoides rupestris]